MLGPAILADELNVDKGLKVTQVAERRKADENSESGKQRRLESRNQFPAPLTWASGLCQALQTETQELVDGRPRVLVFGLEHRPLCQ